MPNPTWRRALRAVAPLLLTGALMTGCGDDSSDEALRAETGTTSASGAFPVTLKHAFGSATIPEEPKRVVAVGYNEDDRGWARGLCAGTRPEKVGGDQLELEKIAALQPDLIMGVYSFMDDAMYDKLSQIAPTVAATTANASDRWQDQTLITGRALGREQQAQEVVDRVERRSRTRSWARAAPTRTASRRPTCGRSCSRRWASR